MRIAQIYCGRVNNALGGTEHVFFNMSNAMVERGHEVACFYFDKTQGKPAFPLDKRVYLKNCCDSLVISAQNKLFHMISFLFLEKSKKERIRHYAVNHALMKHISVFSPDIIFLYWPHSIIFNLNKLDIPVVQMFHMSPDFFKNHKNIVLYRKEFEKCSCIQVLIPEYIEQIRKIIYNKNIVCIPNVVPEYKYQSQLEDKIIIFTGRIAEQKRPELIVRSFALLKEKYPDWKVELWGETHVEPKVLNRVLALIQQFHLEKHVLLCGTTIDIPSKLKKASILLMPSSYEGFSLSATEAMSMGLPVVVCRDCVSFCNLIRDGENGFLCDPTPEDLARHLEMLMSDYELRCKLGTQARADMKQYSADNVYGQWENLMRKLIADK